MGITQQVKKINIKTTKLVISHTDDILVTTGVWSGAICEKCWDVQKIVICAVPVECVYIYIRYIKKQFLM